MTTKTWDDGQKGAWLGRTEKLRDRGSDTEEHEKKLKHIDQDMIKQRTEKSPKIIRHQDMVSSYY